MTDYVLIHGAWCGAWTFDPVVAPLEAEGHRVFALDLPGMGKRTAGLNPSICLSTHIEDVARQIDALGLDRFVLVGHSYGGMVVTGVADRLADRIDALVYLDAFLPEDGQSLWDLTGEWEHTVYIEGQRDAPGLVSPLPGFDHPDLTRQPLLTLVEPLSLSGAVNGVARRVYVLATDWQPTPFAQFRDKVQADPAWIVHELPCGHFVMDDMPGRTVAILLDCLRTRGVSDE